MHILVSHESTVRSAQLCQKIGQLSQVSRVSTVTTLAATYNFAEHQCPDCVFISATFAELSEFELLAALFGIMGIACVVVLDATRHTPIQPHATGVHRFVCVPEQSSQQDLIAAMDKAANLSHPRKPTLVQSHTRSPYHHRSIILIGASTGGIDALLGCIGTFPNDCPPTLIVQHTSGSHAQSLMRFLDNATAAQVVPAKDGEPLMAGNIYLAPSGDRHLCIAKRQDTPRAQLRDADLVSGHRPSVDALFSSAVPFARHIAAAILTGMGRDGAAGLAKLRQAGAHTIGQDEKTSVVYGMPRVAMELGGVAKQLPINRIGPALLQASAARARA